jgi:hypothetical protein
MTKRINMMDGKPVQARILTVAELATQLQTMIERGQGELPVFSSDGRARYPFGIVVPFTKSGYADCMLIKPQPHLHAATTPKARHAESYFNEVNAEADRTRSACGAFAA